MRCLNSGREETLRRNKFALLALAAVFNTQASDLKIDPANANAYVGQHVQACGQLTQVKRFAKGVYLTFGPQFPKEHLTGVIWADAVPAFTRQFADLESLQGKSICLRGKVETYKQHVQIQLATPQDVSVNR